MVHVEGLDIDKWIKENPSDPLDQYVEEVVMAFDDDWYEENENWVDNAADIQEWYIKCHHREYSPAKAAKLIMRAHDMLYALLNRLLNQDENDI